MYKNVVVLAQVNGKNTELKPFRVKFEFFPLAHFQCASTYDKLLAIILKFLDNMNYDLIEWDFISTKFQILYILL